MNQCLKCKAGTYALIPGERCKECLSDAECLGGNEVSVSEGYWRGSLESEEIYPCQFRTACKGGFINAEVPVECADGYKGVLCQACVDQEIDGEKRFM